MSLGRSEKPKNYWLNCFFFSLGIQAAQLGPVPQPNMVTSAGYVPNYTGIQSFAGQPMMYNNSQ